MYQYQAPASSTSKGSGDYTDLNKLISVNEVYADIKCLNEYTRRKFTIISVIPGQYTDTLLVELKTIFDFEGIKTKSDSIFF